MMNTEQILKALGHCSANHDCKLCPYRGRIRCIDVMLLDAFVLIKEQQGQIAGLNSAIETLQGIAKDYEHYIENLKRENAYLRERLAEEMKLAEDTKGGDTN